MRHRGWVDVAALLLMGAAAWLIWDARNDELFDAVRSQPALADHLSPLVWAIIAAAAALAVASVAMLVGGRVPRLARSSPPLAAVLVLIAAGAQLYEPVRLLADPDTWRSYAGPAPVNRVITLMPLIVNVASIGLLGLGIGVTLLLRGRGGPAATGGAVLWGGVTVAVFVHDSIRPGQPSGVAFTGGPSRPWVIGATGLLVVAAGLLVTAWFAGPPADRSRALARCRGGYAAIALLLPPLAAVDITVVLIPYDPGEGPTEWWLLLRAGLVLSAAVAAAGAALFPAATPVLAGVVTAFGLAATAVDYLPAADGMWRALAGVYPVIVGVIVPMLLAVAVVSLHRLPPPPPADAVPAEPETAPVA